MKRTIETLYWHGDIVYLRVDDCCRRGMVTRVTFSPGATPLYLVTWPGGGETSHYEVELSSEYVPDYVQQDQPQSTA